MKEDPQITENETRDNFNLSLGSLNQILHHHLDVWKRCAHWVPQQLTKEQRRVGSGAFIIICLNFFFTEAGQSGSGISSRVMRLLYTCTTQKPSSSLQSGFSQVRAHLWNSRDWEALPKQIVTVFAKSGHVTSTLLQKRKTGNAKWYINLCLPKVSLWLSKQRHPGSAAPPQQCKWPHPCHHSWLPGRKMPSAGHPDPVFSRVSPLSFLSVPSREAAVEGEVVSGRQRCSCLFQGHDLWHASVNMVWHHGHMVWKDDQAHACWGGFFEKLNYARKLYICQDLHIQKLLGDLHNHVLYFSLSEILLYTAKYTAWESNQSVDNEHFKCSSKMRIAWEPSLW